VSLLLDTQALLWYVLEDERLTKGASDAIRTATGDVFVSPASLWEIAIKIGTGKYQLDEPFEPFWERVLRQSNLTILQIEVRHAACLLQLPKVHRDPFDRMIVAQSIVENLPLVSSDVLLDGYNVQRIW
jgi:PIN domain nuclease of toxin-antitoxin system